MIANNSRYIALMVLLENDKKNVILDQSLKKFSKELANLSKKDRRLINAIIYGTLRWRENLDWIISYFSTRQINKIENKLLYIIRIGLYQIVYMEKIPVSAAVNTSVDIAKKISNKNSAGFVNAILRKAGALYQQVPLPDIKKNPSLFISITKSIPLWLSKKWIKQFGLEKTFQLCDSINKIPKITITTNILKTDRATLADLLKENVEQIEFTKYSEHGISFLSPAIPIHETQEFLKGFFQIQDEAAQLITSILNPRSGENILDICAGFGGKTGNIAQAMKNKGSVLATDININKLLYLKTEMKRLGISIVSTKQLDILKANSQDFNTLFDKVLLDAPCTGLGVLKRNPDARWTHSINNIKRLSKIQKKMLLKAANFVKIGGILVYAVCSCEDEENKENINFFLKKRKDFSIQENIFKFSRNKFSNSKFFKTYPDNLLMDGFFAVCLKREK